MSAMGRRPVTHRRARALRGAPPGGGASEVEAVAGEAGGDLGDLRSAGVGVGR